MDYVVKVNKVSNYRVFFIERLKVNGYKIILKVRLLFKKFPTKKIEFSLEVYKTEFSHMDLLSTMRHCDYYIVDFRLWSQKHGWIDNTSC